MKNDFLMHSKSWLVTGAKQHDAPASPYRTSLNGLEDFVAGRGMPYFDFEKTFGAIMARDLTQLADLLALCLREPQATHNAIEKLADLFHTHRTYGASERILAALEARLSPGAPVGKERGSRAVHVPAP